jgi:hypothetical protein
MCRNSSNERIAKVRVESTLQKIELLFSCPIMYLDKNHYDMAVEQALKTLMQIESSAMNGVPEELKQRYFALRETVDGNKYKPVYLENVLDGRRLRKYDQKSLLTHIAKVVVSSYGKSASAEDILQDIFMPFTTKSAHSATLMKQ